MFGLVIWSGRGFWVAVITAGCLVLSELLTESAFYDGSYYQAHGWPKLAGFLVAAALVKYVIVPEEGSGARLTLNESTGKEIGQEPTNTLFFIPVKYWPIILVVLGVIFSFVTE